MTKNEAKLFIPHYGKFVDFFGETVFFKEAAKYPTADFTELKYVRPGSIEDTGCAGKGYPLIEKSVVHEFPEPLEGMPSRKVKVSARSYLVPCQRTEEEAALVRDCVLAAFPFLRVLEFECSPLSKETPEIYIFQKGYGAAIYVPIEAISKMDWSIVEARMENYFGQVLGSHEERRLERLLSVLDSKAGKYIRWCMKKKVKNPKPEDIARFGVGKKKPKDAA